MHQYRSGITDCEDEISYCKQAVRESICTVGTIIYIDKLFRYKQYMLCIGWGSCILGQPVIY